MNIEQLVRNLITQDIYSFMIDDVVYDEYTNIPDEVLRMNIRRWDVGISDSGRIIYIFTIDGAINEKIGDILDVGFNMVNVKQMLSTGVSLHDICSMTLKLNSVNEILVTFNRTEIHQIHSALYSALYSAYANKLQEDFNSSIQ